MKDAIVRIETTPKPGRTSTGSDGGRKQSSLDAKRIKNRQRKADAKDAKLIDPGEVLAACNTIDSCFKLFDADLSGEIDVEVRRAAPLIACHVVQRTLNPRSFNRMATMTRRAMSARPYMEEMELMQSLIGDFGEVLIKVGLLLTSVCHVISRFINPRFLS